MEKEHTHHIIRNGVKEEVTTTQLRMLNESQDKIECDIEWYLSHGAITLEEFERTHP